MAKKLRIAGLFFCLLGLIVFHQHLLVLASRAAIYFYSSHQLGEPLKYSDIKIENRSLVIYHPSSKKFSADRADIKLAMNWKTRQLDLSLDLDKPIWTIEPSKIKEGSWKSWLQREGKWVKVNTIAKVVDGIARWNPIDQEGGVLYFNLEASSVLGGYIEGKFGQSEQGRFRLWAFSAPEAMYIDWHCQNLNCASAFAFLNTLFPKLKLASISSGNLEGHLTAIFPIAQKPYLDGELLLSHLQFAHPLGFKGTVEKAKVKVERSAQILSGGVQDYTTIGSFEILEGSSLSYALSAKESWQLNGIKGNIQLDHQKAASIDLQAAGLYRDHQSQFKIKGEANLNPRHALNLNLDLACLSGSHPDGHIQVLIHQNFLLNRLVEIHFRSLSYADWGFLQTMLSTYWPSVAEIEFQSGVLNAFASAELSQDGLSELKCHYFQAEGLKFALAPWKAVFDFPKWTGHGLIDLKQPDIQKSLNAEIHIEEGSVTWEGSSQAYTLSDIQTRLLINEGRIHHSLVKLQLAGLKGMMDIEWGSNNKLLTLHLEGDAQGLNELLPASLQAGITEGFQNNKVNVSANVKGFSSYFDVKGTLRVERNPRQDDFIHFGLELKKYLENGIRSLKPSGWFYGKGLPFEKFISPFIPGSKAFSIIGVGDFKGSFDSDKLEIKYGIETLKIENEKFLFEFGAPLSAGPDHLTGLHELDFRTYSHHGSLPISQACCKEKSTGVCFESIQSQLVFKNQTIDCLSLEAICNGIYLNGEVNVDYSPSGPEEWGLAVNLPLLNGKVSSFRHLLSLFSQPLALENIPLEGDIESTGKGFALQCTFSPNDYKLQADFQGHISNGTLPLHEKYLALQDMHADVNYAHDQQKLELADIQATLLAGKPSQGKEYAILGKYMSFTNLQAPKIELDLEVKEHDVQIARLVAKAHTDPHSFMEVIIDQELSHLCHVHPKQFDLTLQGGMHPHLFQFKADFHLDAIWPEVQLLSYPLLALVNPALLSHIHDVKEGKGYFNVFINYSHAENQWDCNLRGEEGGLSGHAFHQMVLKGKKMNSKWIIDQFQIDDFNLYADLHHDREIWKIDFLGLNYGKGGLMGLAGAWKEGSPFIEAKIQLLEARLDDLAEFPSLKSFISDWHLSGLIKGKGELKIEFLNHAPWIRFDTRLECETPGPVILNDYSIEMIQPVSFCLTSDQQWTVKGITAKVIKDRRELLSLEADRICYHLPDERLQCMEVSFEISSEHLSDFTPSIPFMDADHNFIKYIAALKPDGYLKGQLSLIKTPLSYNLQIALEDGVYQFKNDVYDLKGFSLDISPQELKFSGMTRKEQQPIYVQGKTSWPHLKEGNLILRNSPAQTNPLQVIWKNSPEIGWSIQSMEGELCGMHFLLNQAANPVTDSRLALEGLIELDFNLGCPLLQEALANKIQELKVSSRYALKGLYWIDNQSENLCFSGKLSSKEAVFKGLQFESLEASLNCSPAQVEIKNLAIQDSAGQIHCPEMTIFYDMEAEKWLLRIPHLTVRNFKPALLKPLKYGQVKSLLIKRIELQDFSGALNQVSTWQASGTLHFLNPSRKNLSHPLLAIPGEIILRLGLDPTVLNPVTGTIYFTLQGDRFYLTKFKDVYSEGRGSKFYLADGPQPSWMDMDGNLSVQIKMKQYNLIFKLAELFTVSIQGNIKKPKYGLQKHEKKSKGALSI